MENNLPVIAKRLWSIMRVVYYMFRKGISKRKFMVDLNLMMKRGKIAGKAIGNLIMFHHLHHHHHSSTSSNRRSHERHLSFNAAHEYEFSCDNSPAFPFQLSKRRNNHGNHHNYYSHFFACAHPPPTQDDDVITVNAVKKVLEMLNANDQMVAVEASPALPGFGRSPAMVRQLRITDSPFPLNNVDDGDHRVDVAAEEFIAKFYSELKKQRIMASPGPW